MSAVLYDGGVGGGGGPNILYFLNDPSYSYNISFKLFPYC